MLFSLFLLRNLFDQNLEGITFKMSKTMKPNMNKNLLLIYSIAGIAPAIPCFLFAVHEKYAPLIIIILFQMLIHSIMALIFKKKNAGISVINLIYPAVVVPLIAYISNYNGERTILQCAIMYVILQVVLNGCFFWIFSMRNMRK